MADREDEFEAALREAGVELPDDQGGDDFDAQLADVGVTLPDDGTARPSRPVVPEELSFGAQIGDRLYNAIHGDPARADRFDRSPDDDVDMYRRLGAIEPGNLNLSARPWVKNGDGISTIRSMGFADSKEGPEILVPTVSDDGRLMSGEEAVAYYDKTGKHLGKYPTVEASNAAAEALHLDQMARPPRNTLVDTSPVRMSDQPAEMPWYEALALGLGEGASFGHGEELGSIGATIADKGMDALDWLAGRAPGAEKVGRTAGDMGAKLSERAMDTTAGKFGEFVGGVSSTVPAATIAGPSVAGQAAMGATLGAARAHGEDESMLGGAAIGGALAGLGGLVAKGASGASSALRAPAAQQPLTGAVTKGDEALLELAKARPSLAESFMEPWKAAKNLLGQGAVRAAMGAEKIAAPARVVGQATGTAAGGWLGDELVGGKAKAQEPTVWAMQSVLSGGDTGLSPDAERRLTDAVLSGDPDKLSAADFAAQMRFPKYQKKMQDQLQSLQREED